MIDCATCGDPFNPAYRGQEYCSTPCRKEGTKKPPKNRSRAASFVDPSHTCRIRDCARRVTHQHHVVKQQDLDDVGGDPADSRNALGLCTICHERHHKATRKVRGSELRTENFEFARELYGDYAEDYLARYYDMTQ